MKKVSGFFLCLLLFIDLTSAQTVTINELQAAHAFEPNAEVGKISDWVELYNAGPDAYQLLGTRLVINGVRHMIDAPIEIPADGYTVLWCDGKPGLGPDHIRTTLPRSGASVQLIASDGKTVMDSVSYTELSSTFSLGREYMGDGNFRVFDTPTPGTVNRYPGYAIARTATPIPSVQAGIRSTSFELDLAGDEHDEIRYTTDGTVPGPQSERWRSPIELYKTTTVRAIAYRKNALPSSEMHASYVFDPTLHQAIHLTMEPDDLWNDSTGIYTKGVFANNTRTGKVWERPVVVQFLTSDTDTLEHKGSISAGIRISGSGSRGLAKRSFKLYARDNYAGPGNGFPFPDGTIYTEAILRADASPNGYLHNTIMETVVTQGKLALDVQPSTTWPVYLNNVYWGTYRLMPPKDEEWLSAVSGTNDLDVLVGPALRAISGSNVDLYQAIGLIEQKVPIAEIEVLVDIESLIDLACMDLYTGRADHDLNVRCYRPHINGEPGRWRWILYDMDLWSAPKENSVKRMCMSTDQETPYLPLLLGHPEIQERLLIRMVALQSTILDPFCMQAITDSIYQANRAALAKDQKRWEGELDRPDPQRALDEVHAMIADRGAYLMQYLGERTGHELRTVTINVPDPGTGHFLLNGRKMAPGRKRIRSFRNIPITIEARPSAEYTFTEWNSHSSKPVLTFNGTEPQNIIEGNFAPLLRTHQDILQQGIE